MSMHVRAHHYEWGDVADLGLLDRMLEGLAQGGVLATRAWLLATDQPPETAEAFSGYCPRPPSFRGDPRCQHVTLPPLCLAREVTCLDIAIYHAAWLQAFGGLWDLAWVVLVRPDGAQGQAHAVVGVVRSDSEIELLDPTNTFDRKASSP